MSKLSTRTNEDIRRQLSGGDGVRVASRKSKIAADASTSASGDASRSASGGIAHGPLDERLGYILRRAQLAIFEDFIAACGRYDIRPGQYSVLTIIEQNPGLSQTKVAEALGIKKPNFVAMVDAFEKRGLVRRVAAPGDRRSNALHLTDEGRVLVRRLHRVAEQHEKRIVDRIGHPMHKRMFAALAAIATMGSSSDRGD